MEAFTVTGPAKNLIRFARQVAETGAATVSVATFCRPKDPGADLSNQFTSAVQAAGIELDAIPERYRFDIRVVSCLKEIVGRRAPDIVQTHGVKSHFLAWQAGLHRNHRWLALHHGYTTEDWKMRLYNQLNRISLPAAHRVVTVCKPFVDVLASQGVPRDIIRVLPNAIELFASATAGEIAALRQSLGIQEGDRVILSIGRFSREKAHANLVAATARLSRQRHGLRLRLVMVGDGPERRRLQRAVETAGLAECTAFPGHQRQVNAYYGLADLFVLPSHSEGSPNVVLEAMAAGVPIVATAVGGVPEMISHDQSGLLVPAGDPAALAEAMGRLLEDREHAGRLGAAAAEAATARFSADRYRQSLLHIYEELCSAPMRHRGGR
jgi:glycosyltransferase involved in cell wall biosynthesis